ncbi:hypothetical protein CYCD_13550 [Tenuifilaceae bacterium CYCD]|nr:hypothetical protein CYCD_13550 [Tenuifilaceae bacterium CYCD]
MLFFGQLAMGQEHQKERDIPSSQLLSNSDYHQRKELAKQIGLTDLEKTKNSLCLRFWDTDKVVDIIKNDSIEIYVYPIIYSKKGRLITKELLICRTDKSLMLNQLDKLGIKNLPDCSTIANYEFFDSGYTYCFEVSSIENYRFFTYHKPQNQKREIQEAFEVTEIVRIINEFTNWPAIRDEFLNSLRIGKYRFTTVIGVVEKNRWTYTYYPCNTEFRKRIFK